MGDPEFEDEQRLRRGRRRFVVLTLALVGALVGVGAWANAQVPPSVALTGETAVSAITPAQRDAQAVAVTDRLSAASGRSLTALADQAAAPVANPLDSQAPIVSGAEAASEEFAETLAQLSEAEEAAAEQLALTEEEVAEAEAQREAAAEDLAEAEQQAAAEVDAAIEAAISAARAQSTSLSVIDDFAFGGIGGGAIPDGRSTSTDEVLDLVRTYFPADEVGNAMAVSRCESGHANRVSKPNTNGSRDLGIFQINDAGTLQAALKRIGVRYSDIADARSKALDPALNVRMARAIWDSRGWQPWVCAAKVKVVAGLYQRTPGPMAGKFDDYGRPAV